ncbi:MAG: FtsX-like permease family protein, partial [Pseudomonadota bacterium]
MSLLIQRATRRFYRRHPGQLILALSGIALGVAVVVAVDLANSISLRAFELSKRLTTPRATHVIEAVTGSLTTDAYRQLRVDQGIERAAPVLEGRVSLASGTDGTSETIAVLGIDPIAELTFASQGGLAAGTDDGQSVDIGRLISQPGAVLVPEALAARLGVAAGDSLPVKAGNEEATLHVTAVIALASGRGSGASGPFIVDIATAQELFAVYDKLTRIELKLTPDEADRLARTLDPGVTLNEAGSGDDVTDQMLSAFRINLTALSLLALVVGMLLIYATMSFAVVQRRRTFGTLRALGVTSEELTRSVLLEALMLGLLATGLGLLLGYALSRTLTDLVLTTINDLYFQTQISPKDIAVLPFVKAGVLGVGATVVAALLPAVEAAKEPARTALSRVSYEQTMQRRFRAAPVVAMAALAFGLVCLALPGDALLPAFAGLFGVLVAYAVLVPTVTGAALNIILRVVQPVAGLPVRLALRGAVASLSRTAIAVTALTVAVATVVGIGVMIDSFRGSVALWLDEALIADWYLVTLDRTQDGFNAAERRQIEALPGVAGLSLSRTLTLTTPSGDIAIRAAGAGPKGYGEKLVVGDPTTAFDALDSGEAALLSEPFARRRGLTPGDTIELPSPAGPAVFRIVGVFRDYRTRDSAVMLPYTVVTRIWGDMDPVGVGVYAEADTDMDALDRALGAFTAHRGGA